MFHKSRTAPGRRRMGNCILALDQDTTLTRTLILNRTGEINENLDKLLDYLYFLFLPIRRPCSKRWNLRA